MLKRAILTAAAVTLAALFTTPSASLAQEPGDILFSGAGVGEPSAIYLLDSASGEERRLSLPGNEDDEPVWSPGRSEIAFTRYLKRSDYPGETRSAIAVVAATGAVERQITDGSAWDTEPTWSADGTRIAFVRYAAIGWSRIAMVDVASGEMTYVTREGSHNDDQPVWSLNGSSIVFTRWKGGQASLYSVAPDGSNLRNLTKRPSSDEMDPAIAPGGRIAFVRQRFGDDSDVCVMRRDGTHFRCPLASRAHESEPAWAPDGSVIAYVKTPGDGDGNVVTYEVRGGEVHRLTRGPAQDRAPRWDPSGERIAFIRSAADGSEIFAVAADEGPPVALTGNALEEYRIDW